MDKILQLDNELCIQIAGPTASGKSALAIKYAQKYDGEIINTDSMQVYDVLNVITARPSDEELNSAPHHLYGHVRPGIEYSTGHWIKDVEPILADIRNRGKIPIFVGGTGLYFKALNGGLSNIPAIPDDIRKKWRTKLQTEGVDVLYEHLQICDPEMANELKPADKQRISRALEVFEATGQSIKTFHQNQGDALVSASQSKKIILFPDRPLLHDRIAARFRIMMELHALEEVKSILALDISPSHTCMKAIGVRELSRYLGGEISLEEAIELAIIATRQYAKRQSTWFKNQLDDTWLRISKINN